MLATTTAPRAPRQVSGIPRLELGCQIIYLGDELLVSVRQKVMLACAARNGRAVAFGKAEMRKKNEKLPGLTEPPCALTIRACILTRRNRQWHSVSR